MPVDQDLLDVMLFQVPKNVEAATKQVAQINANIANLTTLQNQYIAMMVKPKDDLEAQLAVKAAYWELGWYYPAWLPSTSYAMGNYVRPTVPNGRKYKVINTPMNPGVPAEPAWAPTFYYTDSVSKVSGGGYNHLCGWTGLSGSTEPVWQSSGWTYDPENFQPWWNIGAIIAPYHIPGTSGPTEPVWPTTIGATVVDNNITWQCEDVVITYPHGGPLYGAYWSLSGNLTDWSIRDSGVIIYQYLGTGWDGDPIIIAAINEWNLSLPILNPLVYGVAPAPLGTQAMIYNLTNHSLPTATTKRNQLIALEAILPSYKTYAIYVFSSGAGSVSPSGPSVIVESGQSQTFTFTGVVDYIVVDGVRKLASSSYTFSNVTEEHSIKVYFV